MKTVVIGNQQWMAENLSVDHYRNGDSVFPFQTCAKWSTIKYGALYNYDGEIEAWALYGKLYNWYAITDPRGLAPAGWHIPTDKEWQTLVDFLGGQLLAGIKLKQTGAVLWQCTDSKATNESGFTAVPGGYIDQNGHFDGLGHFAHFWTADEEKPKNTMDQTEMEMQYAVARELWCNETSMRRCNWMHKNCGLSVRCIKD